MRLHSLLLIVLCFFVLTGFENKRELEHRYETEYGIHPLLEERAFELIEKANKIGITITILEGFRSAERQNELYNSGQGVTTVSGGHSYHNHGLAFDVFVHSNVKGSRAWGFVDTNGNGKDDWVEVGEIGETLGLHWGGRWQEFLDKPHFQFSFGLTTDELISGKTPDSQVNKTAMTDSREDRIGNGLHSSFLIHDSNEPDVGFLIGIILRWIVLFAALYVLYYRTNGHRYGVSSKNG